MEDRKAKQRLVGAIVIVSLAVIFIPMLLNTEDNVNPLLLGSNIPEEPDHSVEIIPLTPPQPRPEKHPITVIPVDEQSAPTKVEPEAPKDEQAVAQNEAPVKSGGVDEALSGWVVQIGSFARKQNALELRDKARAHGFAAFVEAYSTGSGQRYRVRIGPEISQDNATQLKDSIKKKLDIDGLVLRQK